MSSAAQQTAPAVRVKRVGVGDLEFNVNESGDPGSPTLLFLHGSGPGATAASNWQAILEELADDFHCVAPDVIGFGDSSQPDPRPAALGPYTQLRVETLVGLVDAMGIDTFTVVGNSMGGMWALGMVRDIPERVDRLVLMGSGGAPLPVGPSLPKLIGFYDEPTVDAMAALLTDFVYEPSMFGDRLHEIAAERLPRALRPEVEASHRATFTFEVPWDFTPSDLAAIQQETLVIHGRDDRFVTFDAGVYYFTHIPNARIYGIGKCGHWAQIEHHDRFVAVLREFLAGAV
ncbi:alpha/beta fold hydrolase [Micromonospora olivasterospora]|uniref:2-hydroxymuconate-semialdehyde hydrolase n=1 Tax=Micromonospora olivasterospora TaxID=1880 RepID=A0A562I3S5_MICOL|nr:alpha/beta hydrolase [Micromonospora olivasterospora]TWH65325.1 2-hydroxymuconate-semialdehyde hydrolase [Micromonospora olivasterospora]